METTLPARPVLATHSGGFHLDDAFAYAVLRLTLGLGEAGVDHVLVRTRDEAAIAAADIVWDVGAVFDPATRRFDHHQRGAPVREDGTPFSAAGLIWREHGVAAVRAILPAEAAAMAAAITAEIDREVVRRIDEIDNGFGERGDGLGLASLVGDFNPSWDSGAVGNRAAEDTAFREASALAESFLRRRVVAVRARLAADAVVLVAHARSADPRVLELDRKMPWEDPAFAHGLPVLYAVYPVPNGNWMIDSMPPEPGSFAQRMPLPEAWAGLRDTDLAAVSGVADAVFVHARRFVGAARSRAGALEMARKAMVIGGAAAG
ncbi:MYG1 family protein [Roseomonas sp. SSH11]|uniref:MYG1 family protein n=1 Tax=Pararoseomonas baculiformis TaxID=2820812 RepID=A0ABS4AKN6_9PROT|nr:MYG1 family protein [Pararoseomonas baculiformis]MBP0447571.1 MYG1 family protein [Pararoseomonas baculiformis]